MYFICNNNFIFGENRETTKTKKKPCNNRPEMRKTRFGLNSQ